MEFITNGQVAMATSEDVTVIAGMLTVADSLMVMPTAGANSARIFDGTNFRTIWNEGNLNPSSFVTTSRTITAGNGLTGGGNLSANRTITLGTPGTITNSTTNSVSSTSHTHNLTLPSTVNFGVGAYAFLVPQSGGNFAHNATRAGSNMRYASIRAMTGGEADLAWVDSPVPSGTWRNIGPMTGNRSGTTGIPTLCVRTA